MPDSIPVYWALCSATPPAPEEFLSAAELARLAGMRFARRRAEWLLGRWTAKKLLQRVHSELANRSMRDWSVDNQADGQPFVRLDDVHLDDVHLDDVRLDDVRLDDVRLDDVHLDDVHLAGCLSISHRSGQAACAWTPAGGVGLGIDLERVEPRTDAFVRDYFTPVEQDLVAGGQRERDAVLIWSAKEAMLKALGKGLRLDTRSIEVLRIANDPEIDRWNRLEVRCPIQMSLNGWAGWFESGDFVCTLATCGLDFDPRPGRIEEIRF